MSGNLSFQIEHHLFPDIPSNRYAEISPRVREVCERYGLPYTSGPLRPAVRAGGPQDPALLAAGPGARAARRLSAQRERDLQSRLGVVKRRAERLAQLVEAVADRLRVHVQRRRGGAHVAVRGDPGAQRLLGSRPLPAAPSRRAGPGARARGRGSAAGLPPAAARACVPTRARGRPGAEPAGGVQRPRGRRPRDRAVRVARHTVGPRTAAPPAQTGLQLGRAPRAVGVGHEHAFRRAPPARRCSPRAGVARAPPGRCRRPPGPRSALASPTPRARRPARHPARRRAGSRASNSISACRRACREPAAATASARVPGHRRGGEPVDVGEDRLGQLVHHPRLEPSLGPEVRCVAPRDRVRRCGRPAGARRACAPRGTPPARAPRRPRGPACLPPGRAGRRTGSAPRSRPRGSCARTRPPAAGRTRRPPRAASRSRPPRGSAAASAARSRARAAQRSRVAWRSARLGVWTGKAKPALRGGPHRRARAHKCPLNSGAESRGQLCSL